MPILNAKICECAKCGHQWLPEKMPPKRCAKCKSPNWNQNQETTTYEPVNEE
jgi:predicted Zn-ribbon and HTH transcriptional regulator